jgi:hypothetical protein
MQLVDLYSICAVLLRIFSYGGFIKRLDTGLCHGEIPNEYPWISQEPLRDYLIHIHEHKSFRCTGADINGLYFNNKCKG